MSSHHHKKMRRALTEKEGESRRVGFANTWGESVVPLLDAPFAPGQRMPASLVVVPGDGGRSATPRQAAIVPSSRLC